MATISGDRDWQTDAVLSLHCRAKRPTLRHRPGGVKRIDLLAKGARVQLRLRAPPAFSRPNVSPPSGRGSIWSRPTAGSTLWASPAVATPWVCVEEVVRPPALITLYFLAPLFLSTLRSELHDHIVIAHPRSEVVLHGVWERESSTGSVEGCRRAYRSSPRR